MVHKQCIAPYDVFVMPFGSTSLSYTHSRTAVATPTAMITHHIPAG